MAATKTKNPFYDLDHPTEKLGPKATRERLTQMEAGAFARRLLGIKQEEAARQIGVARVTLAQWEHLERLPTIDNWRNYKRWLVEVLVAFAAEDHIPSVDPNLLVGSNVFRQRLGLPGHCPDCAMRGHRAAHPRARCKDVGCEQHHYDERSGDDERGSALGHDSGEDDEGSDGDTEAD